MGDGGDSKKPTKEIEMDNLSLHTSPNTSSRDLLQRFRGTPSGSGVKREENEDEIELNLGLSLGGRFGVDKNTSILVRSSSVAVYLPVVRDDSDVGGPEEPTVCRGLVRTSSLPVESEEEWRKRKEMQSLRRMAAKRRRSEKQRNLRSERGGGGGGILSLEEKNEIEVKLWGRLQREKSLSSSVRRQVGLSMWAAMGKGKRSCSSSDLESKALQGQTDKREETKKANSKLPLRSSLLREKHQLSYKITNTPLGLFLFYAMLPQKGVFVGEYKPQRLSGDLSPASIQSLQDASNQDIGLPATNPSTRFGVPRNRGRDISINALEDMPCIFTKGDGPNGRRVDGILYKYAKGEEVRIMCVCHGTFHSPAEFVRHAGGTDVDNPLKHIVVNPNAAPLV
ncbi:hypothetical protein OROHE_001980 [Orobanche hederae]